MADPVVELLTTIAAELRGLRAAVDAIAGDVLTAKSGTEDLNAFVELELRPLADSLKSVTESLSKGGIAGIFGALAKKG